MYGVRYMYVVYVGEVHHAGGGAESRDPREPGGGRELQKYTVLREVSALAASPHRELVQALSWNCILFRLDRAALRWALRSPRQRSTRMSAFPS